MSEKGFEISNSLNINLFRKAFLDHLKISVSLLLMMAGLIIIIGGIGLMSRMSMNVMDRTREIDIMRSISSHKDGTNYWVACHIDSQRDLEYYTETIYT